MDKDKNIIGNLSLIGFIFLSIILVTSGLLLKVEAADYRGFFSGVLLLYNLPILLSWISWGGFFSWSMVAACCLLTLFAAVACRQYFLNNLILIYVSLSFISFFFFRKKDEFLRTAEIETEGLQKRTNDAQLDNQKLESTIEGLNKRRKRYNALSSVVKTLSSTLSLEEISQFLITRSEELIGKSKSYLLYLLDEGKQQLNLLASIGLSDAREKTGSKRADTFDLWTLRQMQPLIIEDLNKDFRFQGQRAASRGREFKSLIAAPLIMEKKVLGVLRLDSLNANNYSLDDLRLLGIIASLAAVSLKNALLYERTVELAIRDGLTGLYLRRYLLERLDEEISKARKNNTPLSFLMLDIDHFKEYNDRFGHVAGDILLKHIGKVLVDSARPGDLVARYGGEEFALVLPNLGRPEAVKIAEEIRTRIETERVEFRQQRTHVTVSIGVVGFPVDFKIQEDIIKGADEALYRAKQAGRNRVCGY